MTDVAAHAGVSVMTVSNVINRPDVVAERTRDKVHASMLELRYRNNLVARSLRLAEPRQIGYSLPLSTRRDEYMAVFLHHLAGECQSRGRNLTLVAERQGEDELKAYEELYFGKSVSGFVISEIGPDDRRPVELRRDGIPFVAYGQTLAGDGVPWSWVDADAAGGIGMAVDHVRALGHTELAYLGVERVTVHGQAKESGYRRACERGGLERSLNADRIVRAGRAIGDGIAAARRLLEAEERPTALICGTDAHAAGALIAAGDLGLAAGRDLAVTGFGNTSVTALGAVGVTSVSQRSNEIARALIESLSDRPDETRHVLLEPELIVRSSTAG